MTKCGAPVEGKLCELELGHVGAHDVLELRTAGVEYDQVAKFPTRREYVVRELVRVRDAAARAKIGSSGDCAITLSAPGLRDILDRAIAELEADQKGSSRS